jgi:PAS domain S-box-containing protein
MKDRDKTHKQLVTELTQLRRRIAELEATGRKRNQFEESQCTERDKAQQYLDIAEVILVVLDKKGTITLINRKGSQIFGYKKGELIGKNWFATCLPSHLRKDVKGVFKKLMAGEGKQTEFYENPILTKSGTERIIAWHNTLLKDAQGNIIGTLSSGMDISERKEAEEALRVANERFSKAFRASPDAVTISRMADGTIIEANDMWEKAFGYSRAESIGTRSAALGIWCDPPIRQKAIQQLQETGSLRNFEADLRRKTGEVRQVSLSGERLEIGGEQCLLTIIHDITERKRTEEALRESEERFRKFADEATFEGIIIHDEGKILDVNKQFSTMHGYERTELMGIDSFKTIAPESREIVLKHIQGGYEKPYAAVGLKKDGSAFPIEIHAKTIPFHGKMVRAVAVRDITERKQAEEALRTSEAQLSNAMEIAKLGYWEYDVAEDIFTFNDHFYEIFRTTAEKVGGYKMSSEQYAKQFVHPDDISLVGIEIRKAIETTDKNFSRQLDHRIIYADGEIGYISVRFFIVKDSHGRTVKTYGANQDITERKQAEDEKRASESRYKALFDSASDAIFILDPATGQFIDVNQAACERLGYSREELVQMTPENIDPPKYGSLVRERIEMLRQHGHLFFETVQVRRDGTTIPSELNSRIIEYDGKPAVLSIARDITERKRAEEALRESEDRFRIFADEVSFEGMIIHDGGKILDVNRQFLMMHGYERSELRRMKNTLSKTIVPEYREIVQKHIQEGYEKPYEVVAIKKDGSTFPIEIHAKTIPFNGKMVRATAIRDITERKQTEEALQRSYEQLRETLITTVNALASTIEMKDRYTSGHQQRATQLACAIAEEMGLPEEQIEGIRMAGLIHDIGKLMVPAEILNKPGPLSELQFDMVKMHPQASYDILKGITFPWPVAQIVLQHHERMDGSGYPQGLSGEEILLGARILAVANVVEAMTSHRPYRSAQSTEEALEKISEGKGVLYDPKVVDVCIRLFTEKGFMFRKGIETVPPPQTTQ